MSQILTIAEIEQRYSSEWVLVADPETDETLKVRQGTVICHSRDRDEVYRKAVELRPRQFAMLYTGSMPEDTAIVI